MSNPFVLDRQRFVETCVDHIKKLEPNAVLTQEQNELHWKVDLGENKIMHMYLGNVWENYSRTMDLGGISAYLDTQVEMFKLFDNLAKNGVDPELVYPVFRDAGFNPTESAKKKMKDPSKAEGKEAMTDDFSEDLKVFYVQNHPKFVSFVVEDQVPDGFTPDTLAEKAFDNLKKQGWEPPVESMELGPFATLHMFYNSDKQYQAQFMVKEMYEEHLGDYFFLALPTRDHAVVIQWREDPDKHMHTGIPQSISMTLKQTAVTMFKTEANPLTHILHRISNGDVKRLG
jgi:hypothetical protein